MLNPQKYGVKELKSCHFCLCLIRFPLECPILNNLPGGGLNRAFTVFAIIQMKGNSLWNDSSNEDS